MSNLNHQELELKFRGNHLSLTDYLVWGAGQTPEKYGVYKNCPDSYYTSPSGEVVRLRTDTAAGLSTLTIKARKSKDSITNRHEIDLDLAQGVSPEDGVGFLELAGFKHAFTIWKSSYIFHFKDRRGTLVAALYDVWQEHPMMAASDWNRFLEIEVERGSYTNTEAALDALQGWKESLANSLGELEVETQSLYKIYSGNDYKLKEGP